MLSIRSMRPIVESLVAVGTKISLRRYVGRINFVENKRAVNIREVCLKYKHEVFLNVEH